MDKTSRAEARKLCEAATPGEWYCDNAFYNEGVYVRRQPIDPGDPYATINLIGSFESVADDEFAVLAHAALPEALDEIDRLEARIAALLEDARRNGG